ncbi:MAG: SPW repeat protein [Bradymonadaceae bacterium]|nr:SPW repeat protein [Lujinxingiaceae bacterium]
MASLDDKRKSVTGMSGVNVIAGIWLFISPFILGISMLEGATLNFLLVGAAIAILAVVRMVRPLRFETLSWTNGVLGLWLIVSPFIIGYSAYPSALWNSIVVGAIVLVIAALSAKSTGDLRHAGAY